MPQRREYDIGDVENNDAIASVDESGYAMARNVAIEKRSLHKYADLHAGGRSYHALRPPSIGKHWPVT
jgi:hypothetical protein